MHSDLKVMKASTKETTISSRSKICRSSEGGKSTLTSLHRNKVLVSRDFLKAKTYSQLSDTLGVGSKKKQLKEEFWFSD